MKLRLRLLLVTLALSGAGAAQAQGWRPAWGFVQGGAGASDGEVAAVSVGALWPWAWRAGALGGEFSARTELYGSYWRAREFAGGHKQFVQLGLVPLLRWRPDAGRSPWFVEGGIGLSLLNRDYVTPDKQFSTRWNFSDNLAVGRSFGPQRERELSLRWQHISNAGIKKPNPGEDFLFVRYAVRF